MLIKLLRTFLDRYRRQLLVVLAFTFVQTMCTLLLPALNASIIDKQNSLIGVAWMPLAVVTSTSSVCTTGSLSAWLTPAE